MKAPLRGGALTLLLLGLLLSPPADLLEQKGAWADVRADFRTSNAVPVTITDGLTSDPGATVPKDLGPWQGVDDDSWPAERLKERLGFDTLLVRDYHREGMYFPVQLLVVTARQDRAFHNPEVCFRGQSGNEIEWINATQVATGVGTAPVGRFTVEYEDGQPPKLVYNIYLRQERFAAPERTTWVRLALPGVDPADAEQLEPLLIDLMERVVPHAFTGRGDARTSFGAIDAAVGMPYALLATGLALVPVVGETLWLLRRRDGPP